MKVSFKFKIAIISFAVTGALLPAFGFAFFVFTYSNGINRIDRELRSLVEAPMRGGHPEHYWENFGNSINFIYDGHPEQLALVVLNPAGEVMFQSENAPVMLTHLKRPVTPDTPPRGAENHSERFIAGLDKNHDGKVSAGEFDRFRNAFMISVPLGLLFLGFTGWFLAGRALKPVAIIANTAEGITAKGLDRRIPQVGNDIELERLVTVSNNMLDRLEKSYHQAVRFSADAAHELQTPLTILQGELDNAIQTAEDGSAEQQRYCTLLEEVGNLKAVVQKLLLRAHAGEGRLNLNKNDVDLGELIRNAAEDIESMAPGLKVETRIVDEVTLPADAALLNQVIRNMTSNAAKYSETDGRVVFTLEKDSGTARFTLANKAQPIPHGDRSLLFERFHRAEKSRTTTGSGLGLSLAREIARAHGGELVLNPHVNGMVSFSLTLPIS
jgi:signal transduction histidine kinase